ncbi:hypothetical protein BDY19DRAFT_116767 [Irpex rosettiformis]|uniref:Uncharacterized protein n=1 Tax=Irpex rosettiformis TaxID=378272 RepID=A0ACB8U5W4_9APHY|nr:hypothetical protein BDY19DRAFT_116767 [Irpex rosettiformis]
MRRNSDKAISRMQYARPKSPSCSLHPLLRSKTLPRLLARQISIMIGYVEGKPLTDTNVHLHIKVRNVESRLWAYAAPPSINQDQPTDVLLESDSIQHDPREIWKLVLVNSASQYYTLQNTITMKYAWSINSPVRGDKVVQHATSSLWCIKESSHSGWYQILPVGPAQQELGWAGENALLAESITLHPDLVRKSLWRLRDMGTASEQEGHDFFLKLQNVATGSYATASPGAEQSARSGDSAIIADPSGPETGSFAFWKFTRVDLQHWHANSNSNDLLYRIRGGDTVRRTSVQYFVILNLATNKYARAPDAVASGQALAQRDEAQVWKLTYLQNDTFTITPAGDGEDDLFWTHAQSSSGAQITLQRSTGEASQWKFYYGKP